MEKGHVKTAKQIAAHSTAGISRSAQYQIGSIALKNQLAIMKDVATHQRDERCRNVIRNWLLTPEVTRIPPPQSQE